jgi:1-deoxyxylulose-5-phosphate synthase
MSGADGARTSLLRACGETVEASLVRLGLDAIPLLHLHGPEITNVTDDLLDILTRLREEGKVLHLSVNSFDVNVIEHVMSFPLFAAVMIDYNILRPEREPIIEKLAARNFGILAGMALGGGLYLKDRFRIRGIQDVWYIARAWKNHRSGIKRGRNLRFSNKKRRAQAGRSPWRGYYANLR